MIHRLPRLASVLLCSVFLALAAGCMPPEFNPHPTTSEADSLSDAVQLTHNFARAGEASSPPDMRWVIFQASMPPEESCLMYVAQVKWDGDRIIGINTP